MATTLAVIVLFLPVAIMKGIIGRIFSSSSPSPSSRRTVALVVSLTLTPMRASIY